jgi:hypothetical protein
LAAGHVLMCHGVSLQLVSWPRARNLRGSAAAPPYSGQRHRIGNSTIDSGYIYGEESSDSRLPVDKTHGARRSGLATCTFRVHAAKPKNTCTAAIVRISFNNAARWFLMTLAARDLVGVHCFYKEMQNIFFASSNKKKSFRCLITSHPHTKGLLSQH